MSVLWRTRAASTVAGLVVVALVAGCGSAATAAPTAGTVATPVTTASPSPAATVVESPAATATPTEAATPTPTPSETPETAPPGTPVLVDPFTSAGIATTVDSSAHAVDPSTYRTSIPGKQYQSVYVVFALKSDTVGKVLMEMTFGDQDVLSAPLEIDYGTSNSWGDFKVNFSADGIPAGTYKAVMTFEPTGAQVTQYFTVTSD